MDNTIPFSAVCNESLRYELQTQSKNGNWVAALGTDDLPTAVGMKIYYHAQGTEARIIDLHK